MWNTTLATIIMTTLHMYTDSDCLSNCSGNGECLNGTCMCNVHYQGGDCDEYNNVYFITFGSVFFLICFIAAAQLVLCIRSELQRSKTSSMSVACRITTQKTLYIMVILATFSRGLYFALMKYIPNHWAANLLSMYYPFILSCCSLCVCFWAEAFHIANKSYERPGALSKSLAYFLAFNALLYAVLVGQFIASEVLAEPARGLLATVVQGIFASLILVEVILFLAYGVEVYFKVKGAFANASSSLDPRTLHLSRFGLIFQSILQILTAFFLILSVTESRWNENIPLSRQNSYVIIFRVVELGMVLWFPCVLWNCQSPEKLWLLNPKTILRERTDEERAAQAHAVVPTERSEDHSLLTCRRKEESASTSAYQSTNARGRTGTGQEPECWICYDRDNPALGPLITPCTCKGDVAFVHHECLRRWMLEVVESKDSPDDIKCKVCKNHYDLQPGRVRFYQGLSTRDAVLCLLAFFTMGGGAGAVYAVLQAYPSSTVNIVTIGICVLVEMTCLRYLGYTISNAYNRAKIFSMKILGRTSTSIIMEREATEVAGESGESKVNAAPSNQTQSDGASRVDDGIEVQGVMHAVPEQGNFAESYRKVEQCVVHEVKDELGSKASTSSIQSRHPVDTYSIQTTDTQQG